MHLFIHVQGFPFLVPYCLAFCAARDESSVTSQMYQSPALLTKFVGGVVGTVCTQCDTGKGRVSQGSR